MTLFVLVRAMSLFFTVLTWALFIRVILSWIRPQGYSQVFEAVERIIYSMTEPILAPIRNILPQGGMGLDFSPFAAMLLINYIIRPVTISILYSLLR